jgi:DNA helicase-2/ATP-dependent DNA helicase PcrA
MDFLDALNPGQREAVLHSEGPLLILAGAGSGKTRVLIYRIAHLIGSVGAAPESILAVTFTNKAADEMRSRVGKVLKQSGLSLDRWPHVSTFHSFCVRLLRRYGAPLADLRPGFTSSFTIYDDSDQVAAIKSVYRELGIDEKFMKPRSLLSLVSQAKNQGRSPQDFYQDATNPQHDKIAVIFEKYQALLQASNAFDFDDLLLEGVRLLRHSQETQMALRDRFRYLMIDEYQDTNRAQYDLMRLLTGPTQNVCVVGDEDQSIYSWRGADIRNILDFEKDYPHATVVRLEQNYRSTKRILAAAGGVVANNVDRKGKNLWAEGEEGSPVLLYQAADSDDEARFAAGYVNRYLTDHPDKNAAILYRANSQSRQLEESLRRLGRNYKVVGGVSFYQRAEVKDILAYLKTASSSADFVSLVRIINTPARGIGRTTVQQIEVFARRHEISLWRALEQMLSEGRFPSRARAAVAVFQRLIVGLREQIAKAPWHEALPWIVNESGYRNMLERDGSIEGAGRLENIDEFVSAATDAAQRGETLDEFLDQVALVADTDQLDASSPVLLMTLHSAKGLEFPLVVMTGLEEGIFPHSRSIEDPAGLEEERRLCYVGMTRAREQLLLTAAHRRRRFGGGAYETMIPSRFLGEIPRDVLQPVRQSAPAWEAGEAYSLDLGAEQHEVRETVQKKLYDGPAYNSVENLSGFFAKRNLPVPGSLQHPGAEGTPPSSTAVRKPAAGPRPRLPHTTGYRLGDKVRHKTYGVGTVMKFDGDGENTKLTVHFRTVGLKKLIAKFAGLQPA